MKCDKKNHKKQWNKRKGNTKLTCRGDQLQMSATNKWKMFYVNR